MKKILWMGSFVAFALGLVGCVRVTGTAGYWKTDAEGETTSKRATFDSADYVPGSPPPGDITT